MSAERLARADAVADAIARDVALHDQRGCLSPQAVFVETDGPQTACGFADRLSDALERIAVALPPGRPSAAAAAARRRFAEDAEWTGAAFVRDRPGGVVVCEERPAFRSGPGGRAVRVQPIGSLAALPLVLPAGRIECVGLAATGPETAALVPSLRRIGVARVCPAGRMQEPSLAWPRGQRAPLGSLLRRVEPPRLEVET